MTLLEFLRTRTPVRGPKLGCGEGVIGTDPQLEKGGCGACVVLISKYDLATDKVTEFSASSCLTLVGSLNHCSVITSEGIGNTRDGFHPVQQRLSGFHASQCGFCTPGMCMSIFSTLVKADKTGDPAPPLGFSKLTCSEAEHAVSGNLCRCTGYRPIIDACKSFAADVDLEDLGLNSFWKKAATYDGWYRPKSIQELRNLFDSNWFDENSVKIVASNTGAGVYKDQDLYEKYIDIKGIPELSVINRSNKGVEIGAAVSISEAIEVFSDGTPVFRKIAGHLSKVASPFVRNTATIGGNVIMAQRLPFASDIVTVLLAVGSTVTIQTASKMLCLTLEEFLEQPPCDAKTILLTIFVPDWGSDSVIFETSRAAPRPFGNAVSYVNSAFLARTSGDAASGELLIEDICLAFGAYGVDHANRARKVACACALAAFKLRRPVRMYLDRKTDMIMAGGRHPMKVKYSVGFKSDGTVTALYVDLRMNAGISPDLSPLMPGCTIGALKKYNWGALAFDIKLCKTNVSSKSAMRAPGDVQGSFIAEVIIEHVASVLAANPNAIRRTNLHSVESLTKFYGDAAGDAPTYSLVDIFDKLASSSEYRSRAEAVEWFNGGSRWRKRGISCVPITYEVSLRPTPGKVSILNDGSIAVEVGGVELGQGLYTKVKQMTAFGLGELCPDADGLLDKVRVIQVDSLSMIQSGFTGGSTTSETSCEAVRQSCTALVERLRPIKEGLEAKSGAAVPWSSLIAQVKMAGLNLSAHAFWTPDPAFVKYLNYGAAVSEVEIDVLTGATTILRSDLVYDCGQSLNPAVDLGQVEGAFVQGVGFFTNEEYTTNADGLVVNDGTWTYKIPTVDTIPKQFNVELISSARDKKRVLSSKASGEPPLLLAASVHCAMREAIRAARREFSVNSPLTFQMDVPATMADVKELCGLDVVERHLQRLCSPATKA
ncbi:putative aldehyde oxidase 3 [Triticum urartu]|uniref:Putative aldehyde oxidase 3 n=1 Tax=Triticum urartu TaxID=4572 RepID=M7ZWN3_TRIUA|nr:putative aldehyde oxidase 3 [Triticum urartu]